jgi:hypothetical protein
MLNRAKYEQSSDEVLINEGFALDVQSADPTATEVLACELANRLQGALQAQEDLRSFVDKELEALRLRAEDRGLERSALIEDITILQRRLDRDDLA